MVPIPAASAASDSVSVNSSSRDSTSDPTLESKEHGSVLVMGRSGTGKSTLLKNIVGRTAQRHKVYLINVKADEVANYRAVHRNVDTCALSALTKVAKSSVIIVEDIISLKDKEAGLLREAINYVAHHRQCRIYCVTHTVYKTGLFSMLPLFHYVVFTNSPANAPIIRQVLDLFGAEKSSINAVLTRVRGRQNRSAPSQQLQNNYYYFNCGSMVFGETTSAFASGHPLQLLWKSDASGSALSSDDAQPSRASSYGSGGMSSSPASSPPWYEALDMFSQFFEGKKCRPQATAIFKIICNRLGSQHVNPADLTISFRVREAAGSAAAAAAASTTGQSGKKNISLVDYVTCLLSENCAPTLEQRVLHNYLTRVCTIPSTVVVNRHLKGLV